MKGVEPTTLAKVELKKNFWVSSIWGEKAEGKLQLSFVDGAEKKSLMINQTQ